MTVSPECAGCAAIEICLHRIQGSICNKARREYEAIKVVELDRLKEEVSINTRLASARLSSLEDALGEIERLTHLVATRQEHIWSLQERLAVSEADNNKLRAAAKDAKNVQEKRHDC